MTTVYTDADLDRAKKASEAAFMADEAPRDRTTELLAVVALYRDVWGPKAGIWYAEKNGLAYQPGQPEE